MLEDTGLADSAAEVVFWGADCGIQDEEDQLYARSLAVGEATRPEVLLAYELNGRPLEPQHGFPLRLVVPGWYGMASVKWLAAIEVVREPFAGFQQAVAYRYQRDADGEPVARIRVRALMIPPGVRTSSRAAATSSLGSSGCLVVPGRATDRSSESRSPWTAGGEKRRWRGPRHVRLARWSLGWDATPGEHELACRATGDVQPLQAPWNYQGMGNNMVQRVLVTARPLR